MVKIPICFLPVIFESKHEHLVNSKKERVTQSKNKAKTTQIVHAPFTCYQSIQKKNFRSEFHSQIDDFDLPTYFTFLGSGKKSRET